MKESAGREFTVTIHKTIAEIDAGAWDGLVNNSMFHTYAWMQFMEASAQEDVVPFYIAVAVMGAWWVQVFVTAL
jgi:predicted N-acyltransferase